MEWFAVTSAVTTSLAWAGADARARGAWVSLADVCRQTMTEGRIRDGRTQLNRVCRLARVGVSDLRAAIDAGLVVYDGDDLVLTGWDHGKEREATRAAQRSRDNRQRQQRQESADESASTANDPTDLPGSVREPFANATPNFATEERRGDKTREETPPPSPQGVTGNNSRTQGGRISATAATAQGDLPGRVREPFANAAGDESQLSAVKTQKGSRKLTPKRSRLDALPALRSAAISDNALGIVAAMGVCLRGPGGADYTAEWQRELTGTDAREVLAMCLTAREAIRLPSGMRREREAWRELPIDERRTIVHQVCTTHGIPVEKRPSATEPPP